jgi:hypothetical protein
MFIKPILILIAMNAEQKVVNCNNIVLISKSFGDYNIRTTDGFWIGTTDTPKIIMEKCDTKMKAIK